MLEFIKVFFTLYGAMSVAFLLALLCRIPFNNNDKSRLQQSLHNDCVRTKSTSVRLNVSQAQKILVLGEAQK